MTHPLCQNDDCGRFGTRWRTPHGKYYCYPCFKDYKLKHPRPPKYSKLEILSLFVDVPDA